MQTTTSSYLIAHLVGYPALQTFWAQPVEPIKRFVPFDLPKKYQLIHTIPDHQQRYVFGNYCDGLGSPHHRECAATIFKGLVLDRPNRYDADLVLATASWARFRTSAWWTCRTEATSEENQTSSTSFGSPNRAYRWGVKGGNSIIFLSDWVWFDVDCACTIPPGSNRITTRNQPEKNGERKWKVGGGINVGGSNRSWVLLMILSDSIFHRWPRAVQAQALADFWLDNYKIQVEARSGALQFDIESKWTSAGMSLIFTLKVTGQRPKKRRKTGDAGWRDEDMQFVHANAMSNLAVDVGVEVDMNMDMYGGEFIWALVSDWL